MTKTPPLFLFPDGPTLPANPSDEGPARTVLPKAPARILMPDRNQLELRASDLKSLVPPGHRVRIVGGYVERQDLTGLCAGTKAVEGGVGRVAIAPDILFALWLYATVEGVGSARTITRLTQAHDAYRWICGGVQVDYRTVADFRSHQGDALDELLTANVASLLAAGIVKFKTAAQDGMWVRTGAGAASFRRQERLKACLEAARERVATLKAQQADDPAGEKRAQAGGAAACGERTGGAHRSGSGPAAGTGSHQNGSHDAFQA